MVGNNIALVAFTSLMTIPLRKLLVDSLGMTEGGFLLLVITLIITVIVLIFGEFLPKTLFRLYSNDILYFLAVPLRIIQFLLFLPSWMMNKLSNILLKWVFRTPLEEVENVITRLDLESFVRLRSTDAEEEIDAELFGKALNLRHVRVGECMVPRTEITSIDVRESIEDLRKQFLESKHSRIIVMDNDIDTVLGYVHHQQLLYKPQSTRSLLMDLPFIPEVMQVRDALNLFIKNRKSVACVVDEYGGTAGIITLEDVLEELFGEIEDEHDQEEYVETQVSEREWIFSGRLEIDYLNEKYDGLNLPEGEYHTLSGYLVMTTETIPEQGASIVLDGFEFIFELVSDTKVETIRVIKQDPSDEEGAI